MSRSTDHIWLTRFAVLTALATLGLICVGGLVTSHGAGLSVPDWPTTYGYNMFFFPFSKWVGGVVYEHTHRLAASLVGFLTLILAVWLHLRESRPWLRRLGWVALFLVVLQGVLGGLRVTALRDEIGIFHAALAQVFLVLLTGIAVWSSRWWQDQVAHPCAEGGRLRRLWSVTTMLIFGQLLLGASMRHQHAGLAIPDFPSAYGSWWPEMSPEAITRYNQQRREVITSSDITANQILMQMVHRGVALLISIFVIWTAAAARRRLGSTHLLARTSAVWAGIIAIQVLLGAATIWTNKSADLATAHVAVGAVSLVWGSLLVLGGWRLLRLPVPERSAQVEPCEVLA